MSQQSKTPTFSDDIMPMFYQYAPRMRWRFDLTDYQDVKENADMIYDRIYPKILTMSCRHHLFRR